MEASAGMTDKRPWMCEVCGASFYVREALGVHRDTYMGRSY